MVSLSQRMRKLQTKLLAIRLGSGALLLPKDVTRLHLRFARHIEGGHMGPRKFWRHELVRLQYHNPSIPMTVDRSASSTDPATLSIHFAPDDRVQTIDMKNRSNSEILERLQQITKATVVEPTERDREELRALEEQTQRSARDSKLSQEVRARVKREAQLLEQARGDVGMAA
ncbi:hypothetical protein EJ03DRAFT_354280 [Teratosphaeria nubilosa]|uniref:Ribosomal protein/NADH dehydrogenase domain-containing protein n=1 Tax=Teratosphaeria nubilosa TaxID=161662 RepID=A0A6G1L0U4_9PEZI|nr:hypothetical protein EJ03DRAFT_354280 [Teratosphaeria nubilosa]